MLLNQIKNQSVKLCVTSVLQKMIPFSVTRQYINEALTETLA